MQNPRLPSSLTYPVSRSGNGRLLLFDDDDDDGIYDEASDTWTTTETVDGVSAPGYFLAGDRYVDFRERAAHSRPRVRGRELPPERRRHLGRRPNQSYGWTIQVWNGRTFFRFGLYVELGCTDSIDAECLPPIRMASGAMYTLSE